MNVNLIYLVVILILRVFVFEIKKLELIIYCYVWDFFVGYRFGRFGLIMYFINFGG